MGEVSSVTREFLEQVKGATISQLIEADKAGKQDNLLSANEIQKAFLQGTLDKKYEKKDVAASSARFITLEDAAQIVREVGKNYPKCLGHEGTIDFRKLKSEIDSNFKIITEMPKEMKRPTLVESLRNMDEIIRQAQMEERAVKGR